jgi:ABC-2 type transport system permease protein
MTATTQAPVRAELTDARLTAGGILRSEWVKLVTLRSTWWCLGVMAALTAGIPALIALALGEAGAAGASADFGYYTWMNATVLPIGFSVLAAAVLGCLVITGEYGTGMIRSTMTAAPRRLSALFAKTLVITVVVFVTGLVALGIGALLSGTILSSGGGYVIDPADGRVWVTLLAAAGYPALVAAFSVGVGTMLRNSAGAIAAVLGLLLVVPTIVQLVGALLQADWAFDLGNFLPSSLGSVMYTPSLGGGAVMMQGTIALEVWQASLAMLAWVVLALAGGAVLLKRRDV